LPQVFWAVVVPSELNVSVRLWLVCLWGCKYIHRQKLGSSQDRAMFLCSSTYILARTLSLASTSDVYVPRTIVLTDLITWCSDNVHGHVSWLMVMETLDEFRISTRDTFPLQVYEWCAEYTSRYTYSHNHRNRQNLFDKLSIQNTHLANCRIFLGLRWTIIDRCQTWQIERPSGSHQQKNAHNTQHVVLSDQLMTRCIFDLVSFSPRVLDPDTVKYRLQESIDFDRSSTKCRSNMATIPRHQRAWWEGSYLR
jgi:hypothetical protein